MHPDPRAVRRGFDRVAGRYDAADVIGARTREEMLARLEGLPLEPGLVLDVGAGTGHAARALRARFRRARVIALDASGAMLRAARRQSSWWRGFDVVQGNALALPLPDASVDIVFANLLLPWLPAPDAFLHEARRVLRPRGLLTFSALGPDTLQELRAAWATVDDDPHVYPFADLHDTGDALVRAGFVAPVMDADRVTVTYADVGALQRDLGGAGGGNRLASRRKTLTGKGRLARVAAAYEAHRDRDGRLPATCEIVYGHAWCPEPGSERSAPGRETVVPLSKIGRR